MNKKHYQVFLEIGLSNRKNCGKMKLLGSSRLKICTAPTVDIFE